jgi:hypothetical protein
MTTTAKQLFEQVMALDESDREEFIDLLVESAEPSTDPDYVAAWEQEIRARVEEVERGDVKLIPWREVIEQMGRGVIDDK